MKARHKRIRVFRRLAIAGCLAGLAVPTTAGAMLPRDIPYQPTSAQQPYTLPSSFHSEVQTAAHAAQPYSPPSGFRTEVQTAVKPYSPPSGFRTEVQTPPSSPAGHTTFALHRSFQPEVATQSSSVPSSASPAVIRQIETVSDNSGRTLAIVLAAVAIALALCALAYSTIRVAQMRRGLGSGSH
jgi:hypothetical protein